MQLVLIAIIKDGRQYKQISGFRIIDSDTREVQDIAYNNVISTLRNGNATVDGIDVSGSEPKGSNGSFDRYAQIADELKLGGETADEKIANLIALLRNMNDKLNIPHCIKHYGKDSYPTEEGFVPENVFLERLPEIAKNAIADACTLTNPRKPTQEEMEKLLKACYYDTEVDF